MAKELPYFRFEPSEWDNGNIQMCSRESKGLFLDLCSLYWSRLGELPHALALQKLCNGNELALQELIKFEIFGVIDGQIVIDFLDEQLSERGQVSEKRRNAAKKRWKDASALQVQSKSNAKRREEKREENNKIEDIYIPDQTTLIKTFGNGSDFILVLPKTLHSKKYRIQGADGLALYYEENTSVLRSPEKADSFMAKFSGGQYNDFMHVFNTYNKFIDQQQNGNQRKNTNSAELIDPNKKYVGKL